MSYTVNFANVRLNDYCKVLNVSRSVLPPRNNFSKKIPTMMGSYYTGFQYGEREITLEVCIVAKNLIEYNKKIRALASVLDVKNPSRLIISDEPDRFYYAVLDGDTSLEKLHKTATIQLTFICHNPIAYSTEWKSFVPNSRNIFTFNNEGTTDAFPILQATFKKNACFFQATNPSGQTILIGHPRNTTIQTIQPKTTIVNDNCTDSGNFQPLAPSLLERDRTSGGAFGVGLGGNAIVCTNFGSASEGTKWYGTAFKRSLGQNVQDFEITIDLTFSSQGRNYKPPTGGGSGGGSSSGYGTYQVTTKAGLNVRTGAGTGYSKKGTMPYGTKINVKEVKGNWARHDYKGWNGWSTLDYLKKISSTYSLEGDSKTVEYAEEELGLIEIYGFDKHGNKLFITQVYDGTEYFEYVEPKVFIGSQANKILSAPKSLTPTRTIKVKDDNGKVTTEFTASGATGDFNDFFGKLIIKRETNSAGKQMWSATINKYKDGVLVKTLRTENNITNNAYPKGELNYIGFFIGAYKDSRPVDVMAVRNIRVTRLNIKNNDSTPSNVEIFKAGDDLKIDFQTGEILINDEVEMTKLDIGSEFFTLPSGRSQMAVISDDKTVDVVCGFQERFL